MKTERLSDSYMNLNCRKVDFALSKIQIQRLFNMDNYFIFHASPWNAFYSVVPYNNVSAANTDNRRLLTVHSWMRLKYLHVKGKHIIMRNRILAQQTKAWNNANKVFSPHNACSCKIFNISHEAALIDLIGNLIQKKRAFIWM